MIYSIFKPKLLCYFLLVFLFFSCKGSKETGKVFFDENSNNVGDSIFVTYSKVISFNDKTFEVTKQDIPILENFIKRIAYLKYKHIDIIVYCMGGVFDTEVSIFRGLKVENLFSLHGLDKNKITCTVEYENKYEFPFSSPYRRVEIRIHLE